MSTSTALPLVPDTLLLEAGTDSTEVIDVIEGIEGIDVIDDFDHINGTPTASTVPEQLSLLDQPSLPLQFRLDQRTRERGLAHIAAIKAQLAARAAARSGQEAGEPEARPELGTRRRAA